MQLKNRVFFITGANRGIGKSLVGALLERGAGKIYASARDIGKIEDFNDRRVVKISLDITDENQILSAARQATDTQVLINNAGTATYASALMGEMSVIENDMNVNYYGTLGMMRTFVPVLEKNEYATIANVVSIAAFVNFPFLGGYCASKAALFSITQGARLSLASQGIRVCSVNPGPIDTDMGAGYDGEKTSPDVTAHGILDGLEADKPDIFPDPIGRTMFDIWSNNYSDLENMVADMMKQ